MTSQRERKGACVSVLRKREHSLFIVKSSAAVNTDLKAIVPAKAMVLSAHTFIHYVRCFGDDE